MHAVCPGPVDTNIARDAPPTLKVVLKSIFKIVFRSPAEASVALEYLCVSPDIEGKTGLYHHMSNPKSMDPKCYDAPTGAALWARSDVLWARLGEVVADIPRSPRPAESTP